MLVYVNIGSSVSERSYARVGGDTSITGVSRLARAVSTDEVVQIGTKLKAGILNGESLFHQFLIISVAAFLLSIRFF